MRFPPVNPPASSIRWLKAAVFAACLHFSIFLVLDHFFDLAAIGQDILKRPFVTVGFAALVLMVPLAATSTDNMVKRLGARRWQALHRLVYVIAVCGVIHYFWLVKIDITQPPIYGAVVAALPLVRLRTVRNHVHRAQGTRAAAPARRNP